MASEKMLMETWQFWGGGVAFLVIIAIGLWLSRKEQDPLTRAVVRFKYSTIAFGALFFALMASLPPTNVLMYRDEFKLESLVEATVYQREVGLAVSRVREIVQWSLQFFILWLFALFAFVRVFISELRKTPIGGGAKDTA